MSAIDSLPYVVSGGIQKSVSDDRDFKFCVLDNGLRITLISDPKADKAGAAVAVRVGHFSDPEELPGLAHFLEHMLFLGTEKYPDENSYSAFLNQHGGNSNAYTASEYTNYYFDVQASFLEEALDRFSQFFVAPLFTPSATERELKAVDSEHSKNLQNDMWRLYQLSKTTASAGHPYHKFGTGSWVTLWETPSTLGLDLRQQLLQFHETYYSANVMTLCIIGKEPIETLQSWATAKFSGIKNTGRAAPLFPGLPFSSEELCVQQWVTPVKDTHSLELLWPMPEQQTSYVSKPAGYLSHLFGYEGAGSVLSLLKAKGWGLELSGGLSTSESGFAFFTVDIELTPEGLEHTDEILGIVYQYIRMLKAEPPSEALYDELAAIASSAFRFYTKTGAFQACPSIAGDMHKYAPEHTLTGGRLMWNFQPAAISALLDLLTPQNMRVVVVSNTVEEKCVLAEKWYGTKYFQERIPTARYEAWLSGSIDPALHVPKPNPFIATDFTLRNSVIESPLEDIHSDDIKPDDPASVAAVLAVARARAYSPITVRDDDAAMVLFVPDTQFGLPRLECQFWLRLPPTYNNPAATVMTALFVKLVNEKLNELAYDAQVAKLQYELQNTTDGLLLTMSGFNHKLPTLLQHILDMLYHLDFSDEMFEMYRENLKREYDNFAKSQPYQQCLTNTMCLLQSPKFHNDSKKAPIATLTPDKLRAFIPRLLHQTFVEGVVYGNATVKEVEGLVDTFIAHNTGPALEHDVRFEGRVVRLPYGVEVRYAIPATNPDDENAAIEVSFQLEPGMPKLNATLDVFAHLVREPFFDQLRTKQQLGYLVFSGTRGDHSVPYLRFILQSPKVSADELDNRIEQFLVEFEATLSALPEEEFQHNVNAVICSKLERAKKPIEVLSRLTASLREHELQFDHVVTEVKQLLALKKEDVLEFYRANLLRGGARRKIASLCASGKPRVPDTTETEAVVAPAEIAVSLETPVVLDQVTGAMVARLIQSQSREGCSGVSLRDNVTTAIESAVGGITVPANAPVVVNVNDAALFKASMPLYPQGTAMALLRWRQKHAAPSSKL